jgi:hypothetical protein
MCQKRVIPLCIFNDDVINLQKNDNVANNNLIILLTVLKLTECQLCGLIVDYFHVKLGSDPVGFNGATAIDTGIQRLCGGLGDGLVEQVRNIKEVFF